jgi:hypothetical protein
MRWEMQRQGDENRDQQETENTKKKKTNKEARVLSLQHTREQ